MISFQTTGLSSKASGMVRSSAIKAFFGEDKSPLGARLTGALGTVTGINAGHSSTCSANLALQGSTCLAPSANFTVTSTNGTAPAELREEFSRDGEAPCPLEFFDATLVDAEDFDQALSPALVSELLDCETDSHAHSQWQLISTIRPYGLQPPGLPNVPPVQILNSASNAIKRAAVMTRIDGTNRTSKTLRYRLRFPGPGTYSLHLRASATAMGVLAILLPKAGNISAEPTELCEPAGHVSHDLGTYGWTVNVCDVRYTVAGSDTDAVFAIAAASGSIGFSIDAFSFTASPVDCPDSSACVMPAAVTDLIASPTRTYRVPLLEVYDPDRVAARLSGNWSAATSTGPSGTFALHHQCTRVTSTSGGFMFFGMYLTDISGTVQPCNQAVPDGKSWEPCGPEDLAVFEWNFHPPGGGGGISGGETNVISCDWNTMVEENVGPVTFTRVLPPSAGPVTPCPTPAPAPAPAPSIRPTSAAPTRSPTNSPTESPTSSPSKSPTKSPSTRAPTHSPTSTVPTRPGESAFPTRAPSQLPTRSPTHSPTHSPTNSPSASPSRSPTLQPPTSTTRSPTPSTATTVPLVPSTSKGKGHHSEDTAVYVAAGVGAVVLLAGVGAYIKFWRGRGVANKGAFANPLYVSFGEDPDPDNDDSLINIGGFDKTIGTAYEGEAPGDRVGDVGGWSAEI